MAKKKSFDCVEMKNNIQAKLYEQTKDMTDEEYRNYIRTTLETSDSSICKLWRKWKAEKVTHADS
jgi:hypothetical protein